MGHERIIDVYMCFACGGTEQTSHSPHGRSATFEVLLSVRTSALLTASAASSSAKSASVFSPLIVVRGKKRMVSSLQGTPVGALLTVHEMNLVHRPHGVH